MTNLNAEEKTIFPECAGDQLIASPSKQADTNSKGINISANMANAQGVDNASFSGDVVIVYQGRVIESGEATISRADNRMNLGQGVTLYTDSLILEGDSADYQLDNEGGQFNNTRFDIINHAAHGSAQTVSIKGDHQLNLNEVSYTTCNRTSPDWSINAEEINLDNGTNTGEAWNLTLNVKEIPVFYLPYINFPLEGRKTGLLPPSYSSSDRDGSDLMIPWYWNIAPNMDATITPRIIQNRGGMIDVEYRYLDRRSEGTVELGYLNNDKLFSDSRGDIAIDYAYYNNGWSIESDYTNVTDNNYLNEIGVDDYANSATLLKQQIAIGYNAPDYAVRMTTLQYQSLSTTVPYRQLPSIVYHWKPISTNNVNYGLSGEWSRFVHNQAGKTEGNRNDVYPYINYSQRWSFGFIKPELGVRSTQYALSSGDQSRTLPIASLHGGLYFDNYSTDQNGESLQTLEPEFFWLYVPYEDQTLLPTFYSAEIENQWQQLFATNRYSGADRQSDAHQITLALSHKSYDSNSARPWLEMRAGKIIPLKQPQLLGTSSWDSSSYSNLLTELIYRPLPDFSLRTHAAFKSDGTIDNSLGQLSLNRNNNTLSLSLRNNRSLKLKQSDVIVNWNLSAQWQGIGRWVRDLENRRNESVIAGFEYRSCCWALRLVAEDEWKSDTMDTERRYSAMIELKGLARLGDTLEQSLNLD